MSMQNYVRAAAAPESRAPSAWKAASWNGGTVQWGSQNQGQAGVGHNAGFAMWLLHHNHRYLHLLRWKRLMLSGGALMCNVQGPHAADVPANTKPNFWKLAAPQMEVTHVCNPPLVWRHICHWCNCAHVILSGKHGPDQHWMTCIASCVCTKTLHQDSYPSGWNQVLMSSQSMKNQSMALARCCSFCSTLC